MIRSTRRSVTGNQNPGGVPANGAGATGVFAVEKDNIKFFSGQFKCNGAANDSAADDGNVEYFHMAILAGIF